MPSDKITCPICGVQYLHGTLICPADGTEFFEEGELPPGETDVFLPVLAGHEAVVVENGVPRLLLSHIGGHRLDPSSASPVYHVPEAVLREGRPVFIGRADWTKQPPVLPHVDLTDLFLGRAGAGQSPVSRIHASIRLIDGRLQLRAGTRASTWIRRSGSTLIVRVCPNRHEALRRLDEIVLGDPKSVHVRFRFLF